MVDADKLMFATDPAQPNRCTIGGLLATAGHGPLRHGYGTVRDFCIGVRFVTGDGRRAKGGGRVVKNVAGYDLMKLLIGSYGTLAVITSASFKLFPAPRQTRTFLAEFKTAKEALDFRDWVMRSPLSPMCLELISPGARKLMRPDMASDAWVVCLRAAGSDAVLARYRKELGSAITRESEGEGEARMWSAIEDFPNSLDSNGDAATGFEPRKRVQVTVPPRDVLRVIESLDSVVNDEVGIALIGRAGVGHLLMATSDIQPSVDLLEALRKSAVDGVSVKFDGAPNPWPLPPASLASMRGVKRALDPNNVLGGRDIF
jgi:glycolate oxidase FAD binding subunit